MYHVPVALASAPVANGTHADSGDVSGRWLADAPTRVQGNRFIIPRAADTPAPTAILFPARRTPMMSPSLNSQVPTTPLGNIVAGDGAYAEAINPFHVTLSPGMAGWMAARGVSLGFTTYTVGKVVLIGPGRGGDRDGVALSERNFGNAMALRATASGLYLSTHHQVWRFENGLDPGQLFEG